jgi:hypothetical protein
MTSRYLPAFTSAPSSTASPPRLTTRDGHAGQCTAAGGGRQCFQPGCTATSREYPGRMAGMIAVVHSGQRRAVTGMAIVHSGQ